LSKAVKIANPVRGGQRYTSEKRALHFIRSGRATLTNDGELFFYTAESILRRREEERVNDAIKYFRAGVVFWNGSAPKYTKHGPVMHRPGEARS
jgi:hypothetical protein